MIIIDDCTIINSFNPTQLFEYGKLFNIITIYLSKKYTIVSCIIRNKFNVFVLFKQSVRAITICI